MSTTEEPQGETLSRLLPTALADSYWTFKVADILSFICIFFLTKCDYIRPGWFFSQTPLDFRANGNERNNFTTTASRQQLHFPCSTNFGAKKDSIFKKSLPYPLTIFLPFL